MLVSSHMYYSKTFIAGQFSPDYWEVRLDNVLEAHDVGKVVQFESISPTPKMTSAILIDVLDLDNLVIDNSKLSSTDLSVLENLEYSPTNLVSGIPLSVAYLNTFDVNTVHNLDALGFSSVEFNESVLSENYQSSPLSVVTQNVNSDLDSDYVGNNFTSTQVSVIPLRTGFESGIRDTLHERRSHSDVVLNDPELIGNFSIQHVGSDVSMGAGEPSTIRFMILQTSMFEGRELEVSEATALQIEYNVASFDIETSFPITESPFTNRGNNEAI